MNFLALVTALFPLTSAGICVGSPASCSEHDEVSLVQVKKVISVGSERSEGAVDSGSDRPGQELASVKMIAQEQALGGTQMAAQEVMLSKEDFDRYYTMAHAHAKADAGSEVEEEHRVSMEEKLEALRQQMDQQNLLLEKVLATHAKPEKKDEKKEHKHEHHHGHGMDPFTASLVGASKVYHDQVAADSRAYHDYNAAWKHAYVDKVQHDTKAAVQVIGAKHEVYNDDLNQGWDAWYDHDPLHGADEEGEGEGEEKEEGEKKEEGEEKEKKE